MKKLMSIILAIALMLSVIPFTGFQTKASATSGPDVASYARSLVGSYYQSGYCLRFVEDVYAHYGIPREYSCCAMAAGRTYRVSSSINNIPIGAEVYFNNSNTTCGTCKKNCGHVGIYVGNGQFVSSYSGSVHLDSLWTSSYYGWGWHKGVALDSSTPHIHSYASSVTKNPNCTETGIRTYICSCGASYTETIAATGHNFGGWVVTRQPNQFSEGTEVRTCKNCGKKETRSIPKEIVEVEEETFTLYKGQYMDLAEIFDLDSSITIKSSNTSVIRIDGTVMRAVGNGSADLTLSIYGVVIAILHINVSSEIYEESLSVKFGQYADFSEIFGTEGIRIESTDPSVVAIDGTVMRAVDVGTSDVTIYQQGAAVAVFHVDVSYTFIQWLIIILLFGWLWY